MKFIPTPLAGAFLVDLEKREDERGFFARAFCATEFTAAGLVGAFVQANTAFSRHAGTLRGMHYQLPPAAEVKLVRAVRGAIHDVIVDLRPSSPTFLQSFGAELSAENRLAMYVPRGFAHGMLTLTDDVETLYLVSDTYSPADERGLRHDDPAFGIRWPAPTLHISPKDAGWPLFEPSFRGVALFGMDIPA